MNLLNMNRRTFLKGCCATTAATAAAGPALFFSSPAQAGSNPYDTIVHVFLRGGIDGLNLVPPVSGNDRGFYEEARPSLNIAATGTYGALPLTLASGAETGFGLHPSASGLRDVWNAGHLAIVQGCGLQTVVTRSHFDAQLYLDLGTPGRKGGGFGWISRAWDAQPGATGLEIMPELAVASRTPASMLGAIEAISMLSPSDYSLNSGAYQWQMARTGYPAGFKGVNETMAQIWPGRVGMAQIDQDGSRANDSLRVVAQQPYAALPASWPTSTFARQLWTIAQSIRFNLGVRYATLDLGGWDTHEGQGTAGAGYNYYQNKIAELSQALTAFYTEMAAGGELPRVTVVVQSEFGRRVRQNGSSGTDHGYGNPLLVMGGAVNGRRMYGNWLGLDPQVLQPYFGDIPVTTDYRRVMSELLIRRMQNNRLGRVFPGYTGYAPLGIVQGADMAPQYALAPATGADGVPASTRTRANTPSMPVSRTGESRGIVDRMLVRRGL